MGIRKSNITPSINVDDMLKSAEISHEIEAEKQDVDKLLVEIREAKETLLKIQQDLQNGKHPIKYTLYFHKIENSISTLVKS